MEVAVRILLIFFLVFLNGFFVASEFSLVSVRSTRIDELVKKGKRRAKLIQNALKDIDTYISSTQLGITIASLALGWVGEPALADLFRPLLNFLPPLPASIGSHSLAFFVAFVLITFLHIVLGELAPKSIALQSSERTATLIITPLIIFTRIFKPLIFVLNSSGSLVLRIFGFTAPADHQLVHSEEEIKMILAQSQQQGEIEEEETRMLYNVFRLADITVKQIMVPRTEIIAFNIKDSIRKFNQTVKQYPYHSRFPVYRKNIDTVVGFIHVKDLYKISKKSTSTSLDKSGIVRKVLFMPEIKKADEAFIQMRKKRIHIAIINDEFGGTAGLITMENVIESLVGNIEDEFDNPITEIKKQRDGSYLVDGRTSIDAVKNRFHLLMQGQGYTTIGGLIFGLLGREPQVGNEIIIGNLRFIIEKIENKRIMQLRIVSVKENKINGV